MPVRLAGDGHDRVLSVNDIARVQLAMDTPMVVERYRDSRDLGGFILVDRLSNDTVALGMVERVTPPTPPTPPASGEVSGSAPAKSWIASPLEKSRRSFAKAVTWRATGSVDTFVLAYLFTGQAKLAAGISIAEIFTKIALYYGHERLWERVPFGRPVIVPTTDKGQVPK